jgi:hypothetical protein
VVGKWKVAQQKQGYESGSEHTGMQRDVPPGPLGQALSAGRLLCKWSGKQCSSSTSRVVSVFVTSVLQGTRLVLGGFSAGVGKWRKVQQKHRYESSSL